MEQVNGYHAGVNANTRTAGANRTTSDTKGKSALGMEDFMSLLAAQLSNQDVMKPMEDTQFIAQMAQFTSLEAMQTLTELTYAQYGASMIGKNVVVASTDARGAYREDAGQVEGVTFAGGDCLVRVNGEDYPMSAIMRIVTELPKPTPDPEPDPKPEPKPDPEPEPKPESI